MRIAEGVGSERLGCCKCFRRAELNIWKARHGEGQFWVNRVGLVMAGPLPLYPPIADVRRKGRQSEKRARPVADMGHTN
jgi:hypothetical protein